MDEFTNFWKAMDRTEQDEFAKSCGTTGGYMRKRVSAGGLFGPVICVAIERETSGVHSRQTLRPDDWHLIWPELIEKAAA